jgi:hypothetical protein
MTIKRRLLALEHRADLADVDLVERLRYLQHYDGDDPDILARQARLRELMELARRRRDARPALAARPAALAMRRLNPLPAHSQGGAFSDSEGK